MKKRLLSFVLVCLMLMSSLVMASCGGETEIEDVEVKVYNFYTICGEGTTNKSIREVELALNRMTFYQLGSCVKLEMVTAEEYDRVIEEQLSKVKAYNDSKTSKGNKGTTSAPPIQEDEEEVSEVVLTGDRYIEQLERNLEIIEEIEVKMAKDPSLSYDALLAEYPDYKVFEFENPRLDIFLVLGYDKYIELVGKDRLAPLDEKLSSEAKLINDYVYPTFLSAAKVTNVKGTRKTYGIPMNKGIGEYDYIVFDKEYLDKYKIDAGTMTNLEDLEYYLEVLAENEPDVIPLANVFDSPEFAYLFENGFSAYIKEGKYVTDTYTDEAVLDYYTMIARYRTLGYIKDCKDTDRWAVKFVRGTYADIDALEAQNGHEYSYTIHSYPIATNEDLLEALFCVSAYTVSTDLTAVSKILSFIETEPEAANLLAFGINGVHYTLDDNGQVVRLNNEYNMDIKHIGNSFLTYTLAGENPNKWELLKTQNTDSSKTADQSVSVGFAYYPASLIDPNNKDITYPEPNYVNIIKEYCNEFYPEIMKGTFAEMPYSTLVEKITPTIKDDLYKAINDKYKKLVDDAVLAEVRSEYAPGAPAYENFRKIADERAFTKYNTKDKQKKIKDEVRKQVQDDEKYNQTTETINARVDEICTAEYMEKAIREKYAEDIEKYTNNTVTNSVNAAVEKKINKYKEENAEYKQRIEASLNSKECQNELTAVKDCDIFDAYPEECLEKSKEILGSMIKEKLQEKFEELNKKLETAYVAFQEEYFARHAIGGENLAKEDYANAVFYAACLSTKGRTKLLNAMKIELRNIVVEELGKDELAQNISDTVDERFTGEWISTVIIETMAYNKDSSTTLTLATPNLMKIVNEYINLKDDDSNVSINEKNIAEMYKKVLLIRFEDTIKLIRTWKTITGEDGLTVSIVEYTEDPAEAEEGAEGSEGTTTPKEDEDDTEIKTFYDLVFKSRIETQYYKYAPIPVEG